MTCLRCTVKSKRSGEQCKKPALKSSRTRKRYFPDDALKQYMCDQIRTRLSARHVPNDVFAAPEIPRTLTGKKMELPIKKLLLGAQIDKIANPDAMSNPGSLQWYAEFAKRRQAEKSG